MHEGHQSALPGICFSGKERGKKGGRKGREKGKKEREMEITFCYLIDFNSLYSTFSVAISNNKDKWYNKYYMTYIYRIWCSVI